MGIKADYVKGEVLFAKAEGEASLMSEDDGLFEDLGILSAEELFRTTPKADGDGILFAEETEIVWYKATIDGDVEETVEALNNASGIVAAEPNYLYEITADIASRRGVPREHERRHNWFMRDDHDDDKGLHVRRGWEESYNRTEIAPGEGVVVAVIDTGVDYTHEDLASSMWTNANEIPGNGIDDDGNGYIDDYYGVDTTANIKTALAGNPMDNNGHGTHVAGIIAMADNDLGGVGVAYGAKIMAIKAGQATGKLSNTDIVEGVQYAVSMGADVINMSFGSTELSSSLKEALEDAFATAVLVASAGNDGLPTADAPIEFMKMVDIYPAAYNFVIGVMASDENGE